MNGSARQSPGFAHRGRADSLARRRRPTASALRPVSELANEMVEMSSLITWCAARALRHPELVPPPSDVLWPISGFLVGVLAWWLLGLLQTAPHLVAGAVGLWCALGGLAACLGIWGIRAWCSRY